jgi:hypothetical protein
MERRSRKRSSSTGSEKMERVRKKKKKMEGHCSIGQSPLRAVEPMDVSKKVFTTSRHWFLN